MVAQSNQSWCERSRMIREKEQHNHVYKGNVIGQIFDVIQQMSTWKLIIVLVCLIITPSMLVLHCGSLRNREGTTEQSARFTYSMLPPEMTFSLSDHNRRMTWTLTNTRFNTQSRESLESLRTSDRWISRAGMQSRGLFRIVEPTTVRLGMPTALELDVEISWGPPFVNITGECEGNHLLFSVRPPEGTQWSVSYRPLPTPIFLRSDGTRMADPPVMRGTPPNPQSRSEPSAPSIPPAVAVQSPSSEATENAITEASATELQSQSPTMNRVDENVVAEEHPTDSQDYPAIQIVEEVEERPFGTLRVGEIPFSRPLSGGNIVNPIQVDQRPITVDQVTVGGLEDFDERIQRVRQINHARLPGDYGTHSGPRDFRVTNPRVRIELRPQIVITAEEARLRIPPPPITPKPRPPAPPVRLLQPPPLLLNPARDRDRTLRQLNASFHPPLRLITELPESQRVRSIITRTGQIHPPLPVLTDPRDASSTTSPVSSLRTNSEGIRLEITPASMILRSVPEETRSSESSSPSTPASIPAPKNPEEDPEA